MEASENYNVLCNLVREVYHEMIEACATRSSYVVVPFNPALVAFSDRMKDFEEVGIDFYDRVPLKKTSDFQDKDKLFVLVENLKGLTGESQRIMSIIEKSDHPFENKYLVNDLVSLLKDVESTSVEATECLEKVLDE